MQEQLKNLVFRPEERSIVLPTKKKWCFIRRAEHAGNNPYITITEAGARFKCPDDDCRAAGDLPHIQLSQLPKVIRDFFFRLVYGNVDESLMTEAKDQCARNITTNFPEEDELEVSPARDIFTTIARHQTCRKCKSGKMQFEHSLKGWVLRCNDCQNPWPDIPVPVSQSDYPQLIAALTQFNMNIGNLTVNQQVVNQVINGQVVNNFSSGAPGASSDDLVVFSEYDDDGLTVFDEGDLNACFVKALQGTDASLSDLVFMLFRETFHCAKTGQKGVDGMWYHFEDHRWRSKAELTLRKWLGTEKYFLRYFWQVLHYYEKVSLQTDDTKKKARHIRRLLEQLGDSGRRKRIVEDAIELFHCARESFLDDLDTANLLVFKNGVLDFSTFSFRDGKPTDMMSMQLNLVYEPMDQGSADCAFVLEFMQAIQPDEKTRDYVLTILSLCLTTDTSLQHFWIFTGGGANGKSKLMNLLKSSLGEYFGSAPASLLTRRRENANEANDSLHSLMKKRVAVFNEVPGSAVLQVNTLKLFTGEDEISSRGLYERQHQWTPAFKCFLICNDIPKLDENTWAAWRRVKVVDFPMKFVDEPRQPHERKKDADLEAKLSRCKSAFVAVLLTYYRRFKEAANKLEEPEAVKKATQEYQTANDVFEEFREEQLIIDKDAFLNWTEAYQAYREWAARNKKVISSNRSENKKLFMDKLGELTRVSTKVKNFNGWRGYRLA